MRESKLTTPDLIVTDGPEASAHGQPTPAPPQSRQRDPMALVDPADIAAYMADILLELRQLAVKSGFETLAKVLEIAEREAHWRADGDASGRPEAWAADSRRKSGSR